MKRSDRLKSVSQVMHQREDKIARALQSAQGALIMQQRRLQQLEEYRDEYYARFVAAGEQGLSAQKMLDFRAFMDSLALAIERQKLVVQKHAAEYEEKKRQWLAAHRKSDAVDGLADDVKKAENVKEERAVQRAVDDQSARGKNSTR